MRDQYVGDVSDVLKCAFLLALADGDRTLGVAWYYVPGHDGRPDGRHLEWRNEPAWKQVNERVHAGLSTLPERSVAALESAPFWVRGTLFHREAVPAPPLRGDWGVGGRAALDGADIVFLDPDNGLGAADTKHATMSEVRLLRRPGRAVVFITFPPRTKPHEDLIDELHKRLSSEVGTQSVITLRTNVSVPGSRNGLYVQRQRWFTVVDPDPTLVARTRAFALALGEVPRVRAKVS